MIKSFLFAEAIAKPREKSLPGFSLRPDGRLARRVARRTTHAAFVRIVSILAIVPLTLAMASVAIAGPRTPAAVLQPEVLILSDPPAEAVPGAVPHISAERNGVLSTSDGLTLRLTADIGSVRLVPLAPGEEPVVRYIVHIETDAREPQAKRLLENYVLKTKSNASGVEITGAVPPQSGRGAGSGAQFWVHFEIAIPAAYRVEVKTGVGDIEARDIGGSANLVTQGGNIIATRIGALDTRKMRGEAVLRTEGGHIQVQEVVGDLSAVTAGGHIIAGAVSGDATLRSGGGHIRVGKIGGRADLETEGGNISVNHAGGFVNTRTGGGQIDFGEVRGSVRAQTAGGGIRIMYVSGPMEVVSSGGSICLTRVSGAVQAATTEGTITAWINPDTSGMSGARPTVHLAGASQLSSGNGDIVVFLPRNLAANIEAVVTPSAATSATNGATNGVANNGATNAATSGATSADAHRIVADPAIHLAMQSVPGAPPGALRAVGVLNGGGETLRLKTSSGNIRLQFLDSEVGLRESLIRDQKARLNQRPASLAPVAFGANFDFPEETFSEVNVPPAPHVPEVKTDWLDGWVNALEIAFTGGMREDPTEFLKRLNYSPHPVYPSLAQTAGIEGTVKLQVRLSKDGHLEVLKLLEGEPVLADAAIATVRQWRARPGSVNGKPVDVISTVTFNFQLH